MNGRDVAKSLRYAKASIWSLRSMARDRPGDPEVSI